MKKLLALALITSLFSCQKDFDNTRYVNRITLPQYSEHGAGKIGFLYNDTIWTVFGRHLYRTGFSSSWLPNYFEVSSYYIGPNQIAITGGGRMSIVKNNTPIRDIDAGFRFVPRFPFSQIYYLNGSDSATFSLRDRTRAKYYKINPNKPFIFQINKFEKTDTSWRICSGQFAGILYEETTPNDSVVISEGRFDTKVLYK